MIYKFRDGSGYKVGAQVVGDSLEAIRRQNGGNLTPAAVVETARPEDHPLHDCIPTWDPDELAQTQLEEYARRIITSVYIIRRDDQEPQVVQAYVSNATKDGGKSYTTLARVISDEEAACDMWNNEIRQLKGWATRLRHLGPMPADVERAVRAIEQMALQMSPVPTKKKTARKVARPLAQAV